MAQIHAFVRLDPDRAQDQADFVRSRATVLREIAGHFWVSMQEAQVDTFLSQGLEVAIYRDADVLNVGPVSFHPATEAPQVPDALRATPPTGNDPGFWIVHFIAPTDKSWLQEISIAGGEQVQVLDAYSGVFRMSQGVSEAVKALAYVDSVALFHPAYAVGLDLTGVEVPFTASSLSGLSVQVSPADPSGNLQLRVFDGVNPSDIQPALQAAGATVVADIAHGFLVQVAQSAVNEILAVPGVFAASMPTATRLSNNNAGVILGVNQIRHVGTVDFLVNLDGTGEIGAVVDSGFDVGNLAGATPPTTGVVTPFHPDLAKNMRLLRNSTTPANPVLAVPDTHPPGPHGTHVAGIIAGDGTSSAGRIRGMAPNAALVGLGPLPGNVRVPFDFAADNGARVINNSWGSSVLVGVDNNRYTLTKSQPIDRWCFDNPDVLILFAAGNAESDTAGGGDGVLDARTLDFEATAKNALTVGASENLRNDGGWRDSYRAYFGNRYDNAAFDATAGGAPGAFSLSDKADEIALFSDRGFVRDNLGANTNRVKPDVVAPGTNVLSTRSQWVAQPPPLPGSPPIDDPFYANNSDSMLPPGLNRNLYQILTGTSMATPLVTGSSLLLRQYYRTRFAQMRRPLLLEGVAIPAAAPLPVFGNQPSISIHTDGLVCAWLTPALPGAQQNIVAMRLGRHLAPVDAAPVHLQDNVGGHAAPKVVTIGQLTYLLHRHSDGKMRLSCYDRTLHLVPDFGTAGVVTLSADARTDDSVPPDLVALADQVACVFPANGGNGYYLQRFHADKGTTVDAAALNFLPLDGAGPHHAVVWTGALFAMTGVVHPGNFQLQIRQMDASGTLQGPGPVTILDQTAEIREPCVLWDPRGARYAIVWCDARNVPGGEIWQQFLDANGSPIGAAQVVVTVPAANHTRRPCILIRPSFGYALLWEDDTQNDHFDLYFTLLDGYGQVDTSIAADASDATSRRLVRLSDTPADTAGYSVFGDSNGFAAVYQSPDEINSDRLGIYALNLTSAGAFEAQADPATPLLNSGKYVTANLLDHDHVALTALAAVWTGAAYYFFRSAPGVGPQDRLQWVRLHADGAVDTQYGVRGILEAPAAFLVRSCEMTWNGNDRLITSINYAKSGIALYLRDAFGASVASFGVAGAAVLKDTVSIDTRIPAQTGFATPPPFQIVVGYGTTQGGVTQLRQQLVNNLGVRVGAAVNLTAASGVARHNWFQFVNGEERSVAIYHRVNGAVTQVHCRRYQLNGTAEGPAEINLSAAVGEAINGVLARRPTAADTPNREYGAVWQYRANNAAHWEIRFSRLDRQANPMVNPPAPAPPVPVSDIPVVNGATPGWSATRDAVEPQLVSTYTHEPWANPPSPLPAGTSLPEWSPAYGLAWIGVETGGTRMLYFTVLDENGQRLAMTPPPPPAGPLNPRTPVGNLLLSSAANNVRDFKLVWNGRVFMLNWVEEENGHLHHKCTAVNRHGNRNANEIPSAALLRSTLVNGATNITPGPLPDTAAGYGWGRVNMRQSLAPAPPVTLHVRDDCAIGPGRSVTYHFALPPGTALLRVTLNWTDPPGPSLVNHLHLTVRAPAPPGPGVRAEYRGNLWNTVAGKTHLSRPVSNPPVLADNHEDIQTFKQVVLANPQSGEYEVEVTAAAIPADPFNQQNLQPFALVFSGSGPEVRFQQVAAAVPNMPVY